MINAIRLQSSIMSNPGVRVRRQRAVGSCTYKNLKVGTQGRRDSIDLSYMSLVH